MHEENTQSHKAMRNIGTLHAQKLISLLLMSHLVGSPSVQVERSGGAAGRLGGSKGGSRGGEEGGDSKLVHDDGWLWRERIRTKNERCGGGTMKTPKQCGSVFLAEIDGGGRRSQRSCDARLPSTFSDAGIFPDFPVGEVRFIRMNRINRVEESRPSDPRPSNGSTMPWRILSSR